MKLHDDRSILGTVTHGVLEQVDEDLPHPGFIGRGVDRPIRASQVESHPTGFRDRRHLPHRVPGDRTEIHRREVQRQLVGVELAEVEDIVEQVDGALSRLENLVGYVACRIVGFPVPEVGPPVHAGDRIAQFVADHREEAFPGTLHVLDFADQPFTLFVQPGVGDRHRRMGRQHDRDRLVFLGELFPTDLLREVQVADRSACADDRHTEKRLHGRMVRGHADRCGMGVQIPQPKRLGMFDQKTEDSAPHGQRTDRLPLGIIEPAHDERGQPGAAFVQHTEGGVPGADHLARPVGDPLEHRLELVFRRYLDCGSAQLLDAMPQPPVHVPHECQRYTAPLPSNRTSPTPGGVPVLRGTAGEIGSRTVLEIHHIDVPLPPDGEADRESPSLGSPRRGGRRSAQDLRRLRPGSVHHPYSPGRNRVAGEEEPLAVRRPRRFSEG